ncbi:MAG: hypothetical protein ACJ76O_07395 [Gaiellaceae bacterium]
MTPGRWTGKTVWETEKLFREVKEGDTQMQAGYEAGPDPEWVCIEKDGV